MNFGYCGKFFSGILVYHYPPPPPPPADPGESTFITSSRDKNSNSVLSCVTADRPEPLGRYGSLSQDPAGVKIVDDVLWWWVWISGKEWFWGSTWGRGDPLKDARPWLDPCTAGESAPAKTKPAVERKGPGKRIEIRIAEVTLPFLMSSFNGLV